MTLLETPTFHSLTPSQKRALILRDQLRYLDPLHLDTFLEGLEFPEPPVYRLCVSEGDKDNSVVPTQRIVPPLTFVSLLPSAKVLDLGNVVFPEEGNVVVRVWLVFSDDGGGDGKVVQMRRGQALDMSDEGDLESVPIHGFIAGTMCSYV